MSTDSYILARAVPEDSDTMYRLLREVYEGLDNKDLFAVETATPAWIQEHISEKGLSVIARTSAGELAGILIVDIPGRDTENLGYDIGLTGSALDRVAHIDIACVAAAHRGHRLEQRMLKYAEDLLPAADWPFLMCTISPDNAPSLRCAEKSGYRIVHTGFKYGGHLRHTLLKERTE